MVVVCLSLSLSKPHEKSMDDERTEAGTFTEQYPRSSFVDAVETLPVPSTQNVADTVGCSYDLAYRRLKQLADDGVVDYEEVGGSFVWLLSGQDG
jgi:hypothetical protein